MTGLAAPVRGGSSTRDRGAAEARAAQHLCHVAAVCASPRPGTQVMSRILDGDRILLDGDHGAVWSDSLGEHAGEQARAAVQVKRGVARLRSQRRQDGPGEQVRGARVHLPESAEADAPVSPGSMLR